MANNANVLTGTGQQSLYTKNGEYIAPVIATMYAAASGTYGTLQKAKVTITNIDEIFGYVLSEAESAKLLNLFRVEDSDVGAQGGLLDSSANVTVSILSDLSNGFKEVIIKALGNALSENNHVLVNSAAAATKQIPANYLRLKAYEDTRASLDFDTLTNMLSANDLASFDMTLDVSGGAKSLVARLDHANSAVARRAMFTQLPETNIEAYLTPQDISGVFSAEGINQIDFLPFLVGDKFVCVFDTTIGATSIAEDTAEPVIGAAVTRVSADNAVPNQAEQAAAGAAGGNLIVDDGSTGAFATGDLRFSSPTRRRIALALMVSRETDGSGNAGVRSYNLANKGAPLKLKFKPARDSAVDYYIDASAGHFDAAVAGGMLSGTTSNICVYAGAIATAKTGAGPLDGKATTYTVNANLSDLSDGVNWVDVGAALAGLVAEKDGTHYGAFAIWSQTDAKNAYRMENVSGNTWKLQVNALVETATADQITIRYVENTGRTEDLNINVNVDVNFSA